MLIVAGSEHLLFLSKVVILSVQLVILSLQLVILNGVMNPRISFGAERLSRKAKACRIGAASAGRDAGTSRGRSSPNWHAHTSSLFRFYRDGHGFGGPDAAPEPPLSVSTGVAGPILTLTEYSLQSE